MREEANKAVGELYEQVVIGPSKGPWSSPVVRVKEKNGGLRFCVLPFMQKMIKASTNSRS